MTTTDHQLTRCAVCGRHGWHSTDQCPELADVELDWEPVFAADEAGRVADQTTTTNT